MVRVELKICERCGGLWFRPAGSAWVYCAPCHKTLEDAPQIAERPERKKPAVGMKFDACAEMQEAA